MKVLRGVFAAAKGRLGLRLVQYSGQRNHVHLVVETSGGAISRALQGLCVRIARGLNKKLGRSGRVFADRFHARALATPREVRSALAYVLLTKTRRSPKRRVRFTGRCDPTRDPSPAAPAATPRAPSRAAS